MKGSTNILWFDAFSELRGFSNSLRKLKHAADQLGVDAIAYLTDDSPPEIVDKARMISI
jgi:hypothetical protein